MFVVCFLTFLCSLLGEAVASALPLFAVDLVLIIAGYSSFLSLPQPQSKTPSDEYLVLDERTSFDIGRRDRRAYDTSPKDEESVASIMHAVAVHNGHIFVPVADRIHVFPVEHEGACYSVADQPTSGAIALLKTASSGAHAMAFSSRDELFVLHAKPLCVTAYQLLRDKDPAKMELKQLSQFGSEGDKMGQMKAPVGIAFNNRTRIAFVVDEGLHRVTMFSPEGKVVKGIGATAGSKNGQFKEPNDIAINSAGLVVAVLDAGNRRIQLFNEQGVFQRVFECKGHDGKPMTIWPGSIAFDRDDNLIIAWSLGFRVFSPTDGKLLIEHDDTPPGGFGCGFARSMAPRFVTMCADVEGRIVALMNTRTVRVYATRQLAIHRPRSTDDLEIGAFCSFWWCFVVLIILGWFPGSFVLLNNHYSRSEDAIIGEVLNVEPSISVQWYIPSHGRAKGPWSAWMPHLGGAKGNVALREIATTFVPDYWSKEDKTICLPSDVSDFMRRVGSLDLF